MGDTTEIFWVMLVPLVPALAPFPFTFAFISKLVGMAFCMSLATPAMKERLLAQGAIPGGNTPADFAKHIDNEHRKWAQVVKTSGAKVD